MRQLEVSACRSRSGLTLRRACAGFSKATATKIWRHWFLRLNWFQADTHHTKDSWMDREILQSELTCQLVRGISGYNGEYDTEAFHRWDLSLMCHSRRSRRSCVSVKVCVRATDTHGWSWFVRYLLRADALLLPITGELSVIPRERVQTCALRGENVTFFFFFLHILSRIWLEMWCGMRRKEWVDGGWVIIIIMKQD